MATKKGSLSIHSDNIFPIIKKWLYSDHDIFIRELISNGSDAITKLNKLEIMGEYSYPEGHKHSIQVTVSPERKTISFTDTGLGMTADEVEEYITQIAFSGAEDFLAKYKDKTNADQIIGHFGLGFYSAFMVATEVHIDTLSYRAGAAAVHWECDGGTEYTLSEGTKDSVGTTITLFLNEDSLAFANEYQVRETLQKYCSFMPVHIYLNKEGAVEEYDTIPENELLSDDQVIEHIHEDAKFEEQEQEDGTKKSVEVSPAREMVKIVRRPVSLSNPAPLWAKHPNEVTKEDYVKFYRNVFHDYKEPLFWIHLNMDYPFRLKGILYFPKINLEYENAEGVIKLYNNQVFIADNIKEVIPEFLMLLKGVIDCPDLPLNVSRSALQNDGTVKKIADYITKKVADKLSGLCKVEREEYEKYWDDINPFIKFGCIKDEKFGERMADFVLFKDLNDKYLIIGDLIKEKEDAEKADSTAEQAADKTAESTASDTTTAETDKAADKQTIYYVTDTGLQSQYINLFKEKKLNAVILDANIDSAFISHLERVKETVAFKRIDADLSEAVGRNDDDTAAAAATLGELFKAQLPDAAPTVEAAHLGAEAGASMMVVSEDGRRMQDMMKAYNMYGMDPSMFGGPKTLVLNVDHALVQFLLNSAEPAHVELICHQLYDLALIGHTTLSADEMTAFIKRSSEVLLLLTKA
ncbi:MAG: molecular chaperone HtpG [Lachnospiraceae bacterium]|nr:molecular chaperone HtpG [Lachnospiraceae bacterium]MDY5742725.1 molecular chaperone HtpG [Lachnospiraceae bacterium]